MAADGVMDREPIRFRIGIQSRSESIPTDGIRQHPHMDKVRANVRRLIGEKSIKAVGDESGVGQSWLQRYLNPDKPSGIQKASHDKLALLATYFGVTIAAITGEAPPPSRASQSARLDPETMASAIKLLRLLAEIRQTPLIPDINPAALIVAYELFAEEGAAMDDSNVIDFMRRFAEREKAYGSK